MGKEKKYEITKAGIRAYVTTLWFSGVDENWAWKAIKDDPDLSIEFKELWLDERCKTLLFRLRESEDGLSFSIDNLSNYTSIMEILNTDELIQEFEEEAAKRFEILNKAAIVKLKGTVKY